MEVSNKLWNNDLVQFARLLTEIRSNIDIEEYHWDGLRKSMDLDYCDLEELFDRAEISWRLHLSKFYNKEI